jgi:hypothetical protein
VNLGLDVCVSGSNDGSCIVNNFRPGTYLRSIYHPKRHPIHLIAVSSIGHIVFYSRVSGIGFCVIASFSDL